MLWQKYTDEIIACFEILKCIAFYILVIWNGMESLQVILHLSHKWMSSRYSFVMKNNHTTFS